MSCGSRTFTIKVDDASLPFDPWRRQNTRRHRPRSPSQRESGRAGHSSPERNLTERDRTFKTRYWCSLMFPECSLSVPQEVLLVTQVEDRSHRGRSRTCSTSSGCRGGVPGRGYRCPRRTCWFCRFCSHLSLKREMTETSHSTTLSKLNNFSVFSF